MRHFADLRALDRLGDAADFSLSHGAMQLAAEQVLVDIGTFEAERGGEAVKQGSKALLEFSPDQDSDGVTKFVEGNVVALGHDAKRAPSWSGKQLSPPDLICLSE